MSESTKPTSNEAENGNKSKPLLSSRLFKFRACLKNSSEIYEVIGNIYENQNKIICFRNKKTGSIDWRGKHELATIYSDSYYLDNSSDWEAIYDLKLL